MNYNQNYNNYNQGYNQNYNQGFNQGYDNYNQNDQNNNNNNDNNNRDGGGLLSTLIALAALIGLVYLLLRLLGIDAIDYIEKYIKKDGDKTEEKEPSNENPNEKPVEIKKVSVKETLKTYCTKVDSNGNYLLEEIDEEDAMEGNLTFCQDNSCYFTRAKKSSTPEEKDENKDNDSEKEDSEDQKENTDKKDKTTDDENIDYEEGLLYSYNCQDKTYVEMDASKNLNEMRIDIACDIYKDKGTFEHKMTDGTSIKCENNNCYFDNNGQITTHSCPIEQPTPPEE